MITVNFFLGTNHYSEHFTAINSYKSLALEGGYQCCLHLYRWQNCSTERFGTCPRMTLLISGGAGIPSQAAWLHSVCLPFHSNFIGGYTIVCKRPHLSHPCFSAMGIVKRWHRFPSPAVPQWSVICVGCPVFTSYFQPPATLLLHEKFEKQSDPVLLTTNISH